MTDPYKCGRCGLPVSPGVCAPQPHVFHDRPEQCVPDLVAEVARLRQALVAVLDGLAKCDRHIAPCWIVCDRPSTVTGTDFGHGMVRETCDEHRPTGNDVMDLPWAGVVRHAQLTLRVVASTTKPLRPLADETTEMKGRP